MSAVDVIPAVGVSTVYGQTETGDELQDPLRHEQRTGVVRLRAAIVSLAGDRHDRHVHSDASHHVEQSHQQEHSPNYYKSGNRNCTIAVFRAQKIDRPTLVIVRTYAYEK